MMWLFALYVITAFVTFVAGSIYGARAEKAATAEALKVKNAAVAELNRLKARIVEVAAKRV